MAAGAVDNRPRYRHRLEGGAMAVMSAVDHELARGGVKAYAALPKGTAFVVTLFDVDKAEVEAVIEADKLGQLRTGAASGVAAKYLAKEGATTLGILGCGWQAESQVACIREAVPTIENVVAYCRTEKSLKRFCRKVKSEAGETSGRASPDDIVLFKSNGLAAWDVAIATMAVELARERGVGREL